jgi:hypothetical protein
MANETGDEYARTAKARPVSHFMRPPAAVALLCARHGEADARKIALKEQRRAKRARSKRRFAFWAEVASRGSDAYPKRQLTGWRLWRRSIRTCTKRRSSC